MAVDQIEFHESMPATVTAARRRLRRPLTQVETFFALHAPMSTGTRTIRSSHSAGSAAAAWARLHRERPSRS